MLMMEPEVSSQTLAGHSQATPGRATLVSHDCDPDRETAAVFAFEWRTPVPQPTATATGNRPFAYASVLSCCPSLQTGSVSDSIGRGTIDGARRGD